MADLGLPQPEVIRRLLADLIDRRVTIKTAPRLAHTDAKVAASYQRIGGSLTYAAVMDIAFAASAGAALALIPVGQVNDAIKAGKMPPALLENAYEVMNIISSPLNEVDHAVHVKISALDTAPLPPAFVSAAAKAKHALGMEVEIVGYPKGRLTLLVMGE